LRASISFFKTSAFLKSSASVVDWPRIPVNATAPAA
jgi:hypothetical protein